MIIILYQSNYNIEKTQWRDFMWKKENKMISSITIIFFSFAVWLNEIGEYISIASLSISQKIDKKIRHG